MSALSLRRLGLLVLYCIVLYCIVLYFIVLYFIVLYCIVLYCIVLYCILFYFIVLHSTHSPPKSWLHLFAIQIPIKFQSLEFSSIHNPLTFYSPFNFHSLSIRSPSPIFSWVHDYVIESVKAIDMIWFNAQRIDLNAVTEEKSTSSRNKIRSRIRLN
jgi:hypothetical protein